MRFGPIFSPTETELHCRCPRLAWLDKRWRPRGNHDTKLLVGRAVGAAIDLAYRAYQVGRRGQDVVTEALAEAEHILITEWTDDPEYTLEGLERVVSRCVVAGLSTDLLRGGSVVAVQKDLGPARPDLIVRRPSGGLAVIDHKWTEVLKPEWLQSRMERQETDIQLHTYDHVVAEHYGEPVADIGYHIIAAGPGKPRAYYDPITVNPRHREIILEDLRALWLDMQIKNLGYVPPGRLTACLSRDENYGRCRMFDACHVYHLDPAQITAGYRRK